MKGKQRAESNTGVEDKQKAEHEASHQPPTLTLAAIGPVHEVKERMEAASQPEEASMFIVPEPGAEEQSSDAGEGVETTPNAGNDLSLFDQQALNQPEEAHKVLEETL